MTGSRASAQLILARQFKEISHNSTNMFSAGLIDNDVFKWRVTVFGPAGTPYEGGYYPAVLNFPDDYPNNPPTMKFICPMFHPNIKNTGEVCISILHPPGKDQYEYEDKSERWLPIHTVESIIISVLSMLSDPNPESPMNIEAAKIYKNDIDEYKKRVRKTAEDSLQYCAQ
ncbi:ubiquitin conjugating enzyme, putative [Trichomonas vaginalis G3]|uniref:Ubiquitin conjugating enzyme, putative n=1 Tax=Trichomonas vaginalis (strain ATCC PRA-98 / G3) TaxID=412133 RepID=A2EP72_TRIV3|nr:protein polyubiquitination [Trichomonas vaginalis G3]EAY05539.1 ubiquitin conjugating enzyme, putative [Trichomonas vaginalis G3]KAI5549098.1 protein polyubiquitination [Trichomonas vaginalis G3]|eukprot:XP_001317762.1 ubiquitin conjugating enzyme [Trichomonas vaginalis G3]